VTDVFKLQEQAANFGCNLPTDRAERLLAFLDAMLEENKHINLTAVRERAAAIVFHALDSVAMGSAVFDLQPTNCLDIGTGNGFPGVAIACLFPEAKVLLMDRTLKKLKAIERALDAAGFEPGQITTVQMDAAEAQAHGHLYAFDLITARAVKPPEGLAVLAAPLLKRDGQLLCWLSGDTPVPKELPEKLCKQAELKYDLPAPADRVRRLVSYALPR